MKVFSKVGLAIFCAGILTLIGYGLYKLLAILIRSSSFPLIVRLGIIGVILGLALILASLIAERIRSSEEEEE